MQFPFPEPSSLFIIPMQLSTFVRIISVQMYALTLIVHKGKKGMNPLLLRVYQIVVDSSGCNTDRQILLCPVNDRNVHISFGSNQYL